MVTKMLRNSVHWDIIEICTKYSDVFHLEQEPLTCTSAMQHEMIVTDEHTAVSVTREA